MAYKIEQEFEYKGEDWWEWAIWIEAADEELDKIDFVEYTLHPTFVNPVRINKDRKTKFRLETAGWGVFTVYAKVVLQNGKEKNLEHMLKLRYLSGEETFE